MKKKVEKIENDAIDTTEMLEALEELEKTNGIKKENDNKMGRVFTQIPILFYFKMNAAKSS